MKEEKLARPFWKGRLAISIAQIPMNLVSAEGDEEKIVLRILDKVDNTPIKEKKVNAQTGEDVQSTVKGIEVAPNLFMPIEEEEIASAIPPASRMITIDRFVDPAAISPAYYLRPYYLVPAGKDAEESYYTFQQAMVQIGLVGIARIVIRTKQYTASVVPYGPALLLTLMRYQHEIATPEQVGFKTQPVQVEPANLRLGIQFIETLRKSWQPELYRDEFREQKLEIIEAKKKKFLAVHGNGHVAASFKEQLRLSLKAGKNGGKKKVARMALAGKRRNGMHRRSIRRKDVSSSKRRSRM